MRSQLNTRKESSAQAKGQKKSKGERLGWVSISEYKPRPLREVIGKGIPVEEVQNYTGIRLIP